MTRLLRCPLCSLRVLPVEAVVVAGREVHPSCADVWWQRLAEMLDAL